MGKNIYFLSDAHLGSRVIEHGRTQERRLVNFLDNIKDHAEAIYLLGDMFDFWFEYKTVVPKGFTRFLGKISELTDRGVEVHFFTGNHDIWCGDCMESYSIWLMVMAWGIRMSSSVFCEQSSTIRSARDCLQLSTLVGEWIWDCLGPNKAD